MNNTFRTFILLAAIAGLAIGAGAFFFGAQGAIWGMVIALALQAIGFWQGHKIALSFARAREVRPGEIPWLEAAVRQLSQRAEIPEPKLYLSPDPQPNAFAAGRNPQVAVVCINHGLIQLMSEREVTAVLAHEIGHIKNRDTLTMTLAAAMTSFIQMLAYVGFFLGGRGDEEGGNPLVGLLIIVFAPITATLIQLAISRTREYAADRTAAELMGDPRPMQDALRSLERGTAQIPSRTAQPQTAHMYVASPHLRGGLAGLFSTHPPIEDRIRRLQRGTSQAA